jgi:small subunit ribosomal protein S18
VRRPLPPRPERQGDEGFRRRRRNPLAAANIERVDWKDVSVLKYFVTERGRIIPRGTTGLTAKQQRMVSRAVKQARVLGLLPFLRRE